MIDTAVERLSALVGVKAACNAVGRSRATHYRAHPATPARPPVPRPGTQTAGTDVVQRQRQPRALSAHERAAVLDVLDSERFVDTAPAEVYATLLDEDVYLCSESTMYRLLRERGETGERRRPAMHRSAWI